MSRAIEYLDEAIGEAAAAARWYAERSSSAAIGFADEVDAAITAIERNPEAWPSYDHGTRHYLLRRYPFSVVYRVEETRLLVVAVAPWTSAAPILSLVSAEPAWLTARCTRRHRRPLARAPRALVSLPRACRG